MLGLIRHVTFPNILFCSVRAWEARIGAGLTIVVTQILIAVKNQRRSRTTGPPRFVGEITVSDPLVSGGLPRLPGRGQQDGLAGQALTAARRTSASYRKRSLPCLVMTLKTPPWMLPNSADAPTD